MALLMHGFPNLFIIGGPSGPSILVNLIRLDEMNVYWVVDCILHMRREGLATIEATPEAQARWNQAALRGRSWSLRI